jgi:hypothetical protein
LQDKDGDAGNVLSSLKRMQIDFYPVLRIKKADIVCDIGFLYIATL